MNVRPRVLRVPDREQVQTETLDRSRSLEKIGIAEQFLSPIPAPGLNPDGRDGFRLRA